MRKTHLIAIVFALLGSFACVQPAFAEATCKDGTSCSAEKYAYEQTQKNLDEKVEMRTAVKKIEAQEVIAAADGARAPSVLSQLEKLKADFKATFKKDFSDGQAEIHALEQAVGQAGSMYFSGLEQEKRIAAESAQKRLDEAEKAGASRTTIAALKTNVYNLRREEQQANAQFNSAVALQAEDEVQRTDIAAATGGAQQALSQQTTTAATASTVAKGNAFAYQKVSLSPILSVDGQGFFAEESGRDFGVMNFIGKVLDFLITLVGTVAFVFIIIAGFRMVISGGDESSLTAAKDMLRLSVIGLALALLAYVIVSAVQGLLYAPFM